MNFNSKHLLDYSTSTQRAFGMLFLRVLLGIIFFMQGYGKIFNWGTDNVYQNAFASYESSWIPHALLKFTAYFTSYAELICGLFLIIGLFRFGSYITLALVLLMVSYGHGLSSPIWDLQHVFFRAALLVPLILLPAGWDKWHIDRIVLKLFEKKF